MSQYSRLETRRKRRRGPNPSTLALASGLVAVVALAIAGAVWWSGVLTHKPATAPATHTSAAAPTPTTASDTAVLPGKPASETTPASAQTAAAATSDPAAAAAADASLSAADKAAVRFPGAPALSSTMPSVNHLAPRHKYIALTLDDGYNFQPKLLALLRQYNVHCTTFLVGSWAATHKADLVAMKDAGFEIGNHSWSHPFLTKLSSAQVATQLTRTQKVISSVTGNQAPYLRPPFGATNSRIKAIAASLGYRIVMWDRTFGDSGRGATPTKLYSNVVYSDGGVKPGDVILCHWGSKPSYEALKRVLPDLRAQGYQFVTISELIADSNPQR